MAKQVYSFSDFKLNTQIISAINDAGFEKPTPIQVKAIPQVLSGQDVVGIAQTGTGKTAAYLLPILMKLKYATGKDPRAIIFAPTRELAIQINEHLTQFAKYLDLRHMCAYGGIGPSQQIKEVEEGVDIIVATPGRFMDIYRENVMNLKNLEILVLDEADKMMDMGFMPQIRKLLEIVPAKRQNLLFSATFPDKVEELSYEFLDFPIRIEVTAQATPAQTVNQRAYKTPNLKSKIDLIEHLLKNEEGMDKVIVFTKTKKGADDVGKFIERKIDGEVRIIHANKGQNTRINSIKSFEAGEVRFLVGTDVSSRGIDISDVTHVINFDVPLIYEDYVHRIGRTGRAMKSGTAITFANEAELMHLKKIEEIIKMEIPIHELPDSIRLEKTPFNERQEIAREIDRIKRRENPDFQGAFHEKKQKKKKR